MSVHLIFFEMLIDMSPSKALTGRAISGFEVLRGSFHLIIQTCDLVSSNACILLSQLGVLEKRIFSASIPVSPALACEFLKAQHTLAIFVASDQNCKSAGNHASN